MLKFNEIEKMKAFLQQNGCDWERVGQFMVFSDQKSSILATYIIFTNFINDSRMERWGWIYFGCEQSGIFYSMDASRFEEMILGSFSKATRGTGKTSQLRKSIKVVRELMETEINSRISGQKGFYVEQSHQKCQVIADQFKTFCNYGIENCQILP